MAVEWSLMAVEWSLMAVLSADDHMSLYQRPMSIAV